MAPHSYYDSIIAYHKLPWHHIIFSSFKRSKENFTPSQLEKELGIYTYKSDKLNSLCPFGYCPNLCHSKLTGKEGKKSSWQFPKVTMVEKNNPNTDWYIHDLVSNNSRSCSKHYSKGEQAKDTVAPTEPQPGLLACSRSEDAIIQGHHWWMWDSWTDILSWLLGCIFLGKKHCVCVSCCDAMLYLIYSKLK